jgi:Uma2 family endonuclease
MSNLKKIYIFLGLIVLAAASIFFYYQSGENLAKNDPVAQVAGEFEESEMPAIRNTDENADETLHIVRNLNRHFRQTEAFRKGGELICETEAQLSPTELRIPDIAFYTENQIEGGANGTKPVTAFAIELISANDNYNKSLQKVRAYFNAGVQVVWHIFPELRSVQVFTSPTAVTICEGDAICSVIPAIPDMQITANEVFYRKM